MSGGPDIKSELRQAILSSGKLEHVKAQLRAIIFESFHAAIPDEAKVTAPVPPENLIINELIRDYLTFNGLEHTLAVFTAEASLPQAAVPRGILAREMGLVGAPAALPVLYAVVEQTKDRDNN